MYTIISFLYSQFLALVGWLHDCGKSLASDTEFFMQHSHIFTQGSQIQSSSQGNGLVKIVTHIEE